MNEPARVSREEHDLLDVARALVDHAPFDAVAAVLRGRSPLGAKIAPPAMRVLKDVLAKRVVHMLLRGAASRRIWEKVAPPKLLFGAASFELLHWLVTTSLAAPKPAALSLPAPLTIGDELLLGRACVLVEGTELETIVTSQPAIRAAAFPWILAPVSLGLRGGCHVDAARFAFWSSGDGAVVLDALSSSLARRVIEGERRKRSIVRTEDAIAVGRAQEKVYAALLDAFDASGRRDLATFLVDAARVLAPAGTPIVEVAQRIAPHLDPSRPLAERTEAQRRSAAVFRAVVRVGKWHEAHRAVRFVDDDYEQAQALLSRWEAFGVEGFTRADDVVRAIESLALS